MYFIIELQTDSGVGTATAQSKLLKDDAMSEYHKVLSEAAQSSIEYHGCVVMDEKGQYIARECYYHPKAEEE